MTRSEVVDLILDVIREDPRRSAPGDLGESARLFGKSSIFDSLSLVSLIAETEARINDRCGAAIILTSERAMSRQHSPFRTVGSLADYICELLGENRQEV